MLLRHSFSFQSTDCSSTLFLCEAIRMRGVFISDGEDGNSISVGPRTGADWKVRLKAVSFVTRVQKEGSATEGVSVGNL